MKNYDEQLDKFGLLMTELEQVINNLNLPDEEYYQVDNKLVEIQELVENAYGQGE